MILIARLFLIAGFLSATMLFSADKARAEIVAIMGAVH
jgi:hypothetical protein